MTIHFFWNMHPPMSVTLRPDFPNYPAGPDPFCSLCGTRHSFETTCPATCQVRPADEPANNLLHALRALSLDWRGKSVTEFTTQDTLEFAEWAINEIERLREERDRYLGRAVRAEAELHDTTAERDMDMGDRVERLRREY